MMNYMNDRSLIRMASLSKTLRAEARPLIERQRVRKLQAFNRVVSAYRAIISQALRKIYTNKLRGYIGKTTSSTGFYAVHADAPAGWFVLLFLKPWRGYRTRHWNKTMVVARFQVDLTRPFAIVDVDPKLTNPLWRRAIKSV